MKTASVSAGSVAGLVTVVLTLSLASLVFSGPLAVALPLASMVILGAAALMNLVVARWGSIPGTVIIPQDATSAVMAAALAATVVGLPSDVAVSTAVVMIAVASGTTAVVMILLGGFRVGSLVRYIPYPVMGGFLAGTGVLLVTGASDLITGGFEWTNARVGSLVLGLVLGAALLAVAERNTHPLAVPGLIVAAIGAFFLALAMAGISVDEARGLGLLGATSTGFGVPEVAFGAVEWTAVVSAIPALVTIPIVAVVSLLLNVGGLELIIGRDADFDGELRVAGLANAVGAVSGASAGYHAVSLSALGYRMGVRSRAVTLVVAAVCVVGAIAGPVLVSFLPVPVVGSVLAMLGFSFLWDWVVVGVRRMTLIEYLLMLVISLGMVVLGFLIGIAFGLAAAVLLFAATYSRLDPIRYTFTAADRTSSLERAAAERAHLEARGRAVRVVELEGFLFFGTAHTAARTVLAELDPADTCAVVIDLRRVQGLDSTSSMVFSKLARKLGDMGAVLVISNADTEAANSLRRADLPISPGVVFVSDIDHALEYCENLLLADMEPGASNPWLLPDDIWSRLLPYLDRVELTTGAVLADMGEHDRCVFVVDQGRIGVEIPVGDRWQRVRSAGRGGVLGEMAMYGDGRRSARLVVEEPGVVYRLSPEGIAELERTDPACAIAFHRALAAVLSERLDSSNHFIRALAR